MLKMRIGIPRRNPIASRKRPLRRSLGSDLNRLDAHVIRPHEYKELPELTDEMLLRGNLTKRRRSAKRIRRSGSGTGSRRRSIAERQTSSGGIFEPWSGGRLKDPSEAARYLESVLAAGGDQATFMLALRRIALDQGGISEVTRKAKLTSEATNRVLSKTGNPELKTLKAILKAMGLQIAIKPIES